MATFGAAMSAKTLRFDLGGGKWQSMSQFVESDAMGHNGYWDTYGTPDDELNSDYATPIRGNYVLTCAVVLGKPLADEVDSVSFATNHARQPGIQSGMALIMMNHS